jgi:hypothetical protein
VQQRFIQSGAVYSTFFEDNYVADVLGCPPGEVETHLGAALEVSAEALRAGLRERSRHFLPRAKKYQRRERFEAVQGAAIEWLKEQAGPFQEQARVVWHERFEGGRHGSPVAEAPDIGQWLETPTFFTELRRRPDLRAALWPKPTETDRKAAFREQMLRAQMLASAARLGHGLIDLYVMTVRRLASLETRAEEVTTEQEGEGAVGRITEYLDRLDSQRTTPLSAREWGGYDELAEIARNFDLIVDVNQPALRQLPLGEVAARVGRLLGQQQPVGGMSGEVNQTLVHQFRMPGYPLVLISTDLLQEGEDLHTFCSSVHHYGISWTPSAMEQRIGRIDRVRSQTDRRLSSQDSRLPEDHELLQVYYPHLEDTVEVLQVQRVLERMNVFLRLMHEGLVMPGNEDRTIDVGKEIVRGRRAVPQIREQLRSAFPVVPGHLRGPERPLATTPGAAEQLAARFGRLVNTPLPGLEITWEPPKERGVLLGTVRLGGRIQPFRMQLESLGDIPLVRCISPVGSVDLDMESADIVHSGQARPMKIGAIRTIRDRTYDLTVEGDVLLGGDPTTDRERVAMLIGRTVRDADSLEQAHLPGRDAALETFRTDLEQEGSGETVDEQ